MDGKKELFSKREKWVMVLVEGPRATVCFMWSKVRVCGIRYSTYRISSMS